MNHARLAERLGHRFSDPELLERALTHRSHAHERGGGVRESYERLEFLGDALLGFLCSDWLCRDDDDAAEGVLTRRKQTVVRTETLAEIAGELGLGEALRLGKGEESTGGRAKPSLLADVFEAVLGAVYLDGGLRAARAFFRRHLLDRLRLAAESDVVREDYKTRLQERSQARLRLTPVYRIVRTKGPDHERSFEVEVRLKGVLRAGGKGRSRKTAEQVAARRALERLDETWGRSEEG